MSASWLADLFSEKAEEELQAAVRKVLRYGFGRVTIEIAHGKVRLVGTETTQLVQTHDAETDHKPAGD